MGQRVTIEGSKATPGDRLDPGERATVELTDYIRTLIRNGSVILLDGSLDEPPEDPQHATEAPQVDSVDDSVDSRPQAGGGGGGHAFIETSVIPVDQLGGTYDVSGGFTVGPVTLAAGAAEPPVVSPPARNASRAEWAEFLDNHDPEPIDYPAGAGRDALIAAYGDWLAQQQEPSGDG